ncbi:MAG: hypothetical protein LBQ46_01985 [Treponema sp.]|nr:hypothetical protein [Treponema sp.]
MQKLSRQGVRIGLLGWLSLTMVCAAVYIIGERDHDCCGDGCPVCHQLEIAQRLIEAFGQFCAALLLAAFLAGLLGRIRSLSLCRGAPATLVALKIKCNC